LLAVTANIARLQAEQNEEIKTRAIITADVVDEGPRLTLQQQRQQEAELMARLPR